MGLALVAGLVPDRQGAVLDGRRALCEQLAIDCSFAAQRGGGPVRVSITDTPWALASPISASRLPQVPAG